MIQRKEYLDLLKKWKDEQVIKVITGIRRCGKSTLLNLYQDYLRTQGVADEQIVYVNFEELEYEDLLDYKVLYQYIKSRLHPEKITYIFLDEIQQVTDFQKAVDSLSRQQTEQLTETGFPGYLSGAQMDKGDPA